MSASGNSKLMGISVVAIAIALVAIFVASYSLTNIATLDERDEDDDEKYATQTREIWLFTQVDEHIDEDKFSIPPDQFSHDSIVVNKGDNVKVHFYNLEPVESQEHHTFTITHPYDVNYDINAGEEVSIVFTATESGIYDYFCSYHLPTMRGQLIVLDD